MNTIPYILDILKYTISGVGIIYIAFYMFKPYLDKSEGIQLLELKRTIANQTLPMRLQAYERVVLFIERVNPASMLLRLNGSAETAAELQAIIINEVRNEYQHNVTQQSYVSARVWAVIKRVKEDTLNVITNAVKAMPPDTSALELSKTILVHMSKLEDNPYDMALSLIRQDMEELF
jgi:signal transduction histidine kinase